MSDTDHGPSERGYTVYRDAPRTNGAGFNGQGAANGGDTNNRRTDDGKERTHQARVMVNIGSAMPAAIAGTIPIGPFLTIVAANYPTFLWTPCLTTVEDGSTARPMAPAQRQHMSQHRCWGLWPA
jgi:hypothetical protein